MGKPTELLFHYQRIERKYGRVTAPAGHRPGTVTDDTGLALALANGIVQHGRVISSDELMSAWRHYPEFTWRKFVKAF